MFKDYTTRKERLGKKPFNFLKALLITIAVIIASYFILGFLVDFWFINTCGYYNDCYVINSLK